MFGQRHLLVGFVKLIRAFCLDFFLHYLYFLDFRVAPYILRPIIIHFYYDNAPIISTKLIFYARFRLYGDIVLNSKSDRYTV